MIPILRQFLEQDQANLVSLLLLSIPLSFVLRALKHKYLILATTISISVIFHSILFPTQKYFLWVQQHIVYILLWLCPRRMVGITVLIESFAFLTLVQLRRMYIAYAVNGVDITGILMMQMFLYIGLAFNYQNGGKNQNQLTQDQIKRSVKEFPSYINYLGFVFFLPSCLIGPVFQYTDFINYIQRKNGYENMPSTLKPAITQLRTFLLFFVMYIVGTKTFPLLHTVTDQFDHSSYLYKLWFIGWCILSLEFKYVAAWSLGMISVQASGLSYDDQKKNFQKIRVTNPSDFYFDPSLKKKAQAWNMSIQVALKRYIFENLYDPKGDYKDEKQKSKKRKKAALYTFLVSAYWHGLYPGYLIAFLHWMIYLFLSQDLFVARKKNPKLQEFWQKYKIGYFQNIVSNYVFTYFGVFFHLMIWKNIQAVLLTTYFIPFFVLYAGYFFVSNKLRFKKQKQK